MRTYTWVAVLSMASLALLLWLGPCPRPMPTRVTLAQDGPWSEVTLDDGERIWELQPGESLTLAPGTYRMMSFGRDGHASPGEVIVGSTHIILGAGEEAAPTDLRDVSR